MTILSQVGAGIENNNFELTLTTQNIDWMAQDYSNSIANAVELLQFCTKPLMLSSQKTATSSLKTN